MWTYKKVQEQLQRPANTSPSDVIIGIERTNIHFRWFWWTSHRVAILFSSASPVEMEQNKSREYSMNDLDDVDYRSFAQSREQWVLCRRMVSRNRYASSNGREDEVVLLVVPLERHGGAIIVLVAYLLVDCAFWVFLLLVNVFFDELWSIDGCFRFVLGFFFPIVFIERFEVVESEMEFDGVVR